MPGGVGVFDSFAWRSIDGLGQVAFLSLVRDVDPSRSGISSWLGVGSDNDLIPIVRPGFDAPGTEGVFRGSDSLVTNGAGQAAFLGFIAGDGIGPPDQNWQGVWRRDAAGAITKLVQSGEPAPGTDVVFGDFLVNTDLLAAGSPSIDQSGRVAFYGRLTGEGVDRSNDFGLWAERVPGELELAVREGQAMPGVVAKFVANGLLARPLANASGALLINVEIDRVGDGEADGYGLWTRNMHGDLALVAATGQPAPGTSEVFSFPFGASINNRGRVAFSATLSDANQLPSKNTGLWAQDLDGVLELVVSEGSWIDVSDDPGITDFRLVESFDAVSGGALDGQRSFFNGAGQVAFTARFTDGTSGIFVSSVVAVPEPCCLAVLTLTAGVIYKPRRRRPR